MKKTILLSAIIFSSLIYKTADAQISVNFNIGSQPAWGPVGYDYVDYYYIPDIDTYYDVPNHQYVYLNNNAWVRSRALPARYASYNVYNGYKVVINEPEPWRRADVVRAKYVGYKGRHDQVVIRNSPDIKYKKHWKPGKGNNGNGKAKGKGNGKGHGKGNKH